MEADVGPYEGEVGLKMGDTGLYVRDLGLYRLLPWSSESMVDVVFCGPPDC